MLVAAATLALMVAMLATIIHQASNNWTSSESGNERRQNARSIIDAISRDLQTALLPVSRQAGDSLQFVKNPPSLTERYPDALFWQAPIASDPALGEIAEIGYFVRWITAPNGPPQPVLCRFAVGPVQADGNANPDYRIVSHPSDWINPALLAKVAPADRAHDYAGLFAENVVGFWARCVDPSGQDLGAFNSRTGPPPGTLPAAVEVGIVVLDRRAASRITPALQSQLIALTQDPTRAPNARAFLEALQSDNSFRPLWNGVRAYSSTIPILSSR